MEILVQNSLPSKAPQFCPQPFWFMNGIEKSVRIGTHNFNYVDYLEAWEGFNCYTYRSYNALAEINDKIKEAFREAHEGRYYNSKKNKKK